MFGVLADDVLPLIRTRADLHRWSASNAHGGQMHEAIDNLEAAADTIDPGEFYQVTHKALASAIKIIARADDSSGIIGDACRRLLALHPVAAARAGVAPSTLVKWMITFQFYGDVDFFELDPVAYASALGERGVATYRRRLDEIAETLEPRGQDLRSSPNSGEWFTLEWNAQRLAVLDRDVEAIIRTHARDMKVAAWLEDTSKALEEIGEIDLAIEWAERAVEFDSGHQSLAAARSWCRLLEEHRPDDLVDARLTVFRKWPSASTAAALHDSAGASWITHRDEVMTTLGNTPREAVLFTLTTLDDPIAAWELAHSSELSDDRVWSDLLEAYQSIDPIAVLPKHRELVESTLVATNVRNYRSAALRLRRMRKLAAGTTAAPDLDAYIVELRNTHRRRTRLQQEFDRCKLP
ncbi:hypothetical protein [Dietzia alimentaria]|uniref:hypothetical protein n=1 Tax=Dietzia alimentaria TaxID=665550 RepID=UPI00029A3D7E